MKFHIDYKNYPEEKVLTYRNDEYSFDMEPWVDFMDIELVLNKLTLTVVNKQIIQLSGFCGLSTLMNSNICVPNYSKGKLKVEHNLKNGFAYEIHDEDQPVYLNTKSGWVCIGDPLKLGNTVEFIKNCVAVISCKGEWLSLWLKPQSLPKL
ncbi:MAG: hypothetical protein AAGA02_16060 [Bacteroidota bacterium]